MTEIFEYNFTFTKFTKFWIYTINKKYWKNIESNLIYLSSYYKYNISKGDIIFIYILKDNLSIGFVICLKVKTDMLKNVNEIEIFKDSNMNNYYVKIASYYKFNNNYSVKKIDTLMKQKCPNYTSAIKFRKDYIYGNASFCQLNYKVGIVLFSVLNQFEKIFLNICNDEEIQDDMIDEFIASKISTTEYDNYSLDYDIIKSKIIVDKSDDDSEDETKNYINEDLENELSYDNSDIDSKNYVNEDLENTSYNTNTSNSSKNYINEDLENQILENISDNDSNNFVNEDLENNDTISSSEENDSSEDEVSSDSDNESINSDKNYNINFDTSLIKNKVNIPILLIPCQEFKKREMYQKILEHYFSCSKCMKYNNNTVELTKKNIKNMEIKIITKNSELLDNIENSYMSIDDYTVKRNIIYYIDVDDAIHDKCFFIIN